MIILLLMATKMAIESAKDRSNKSNSKLVIDISVTITLFRTFTIETPCIANIWCIVTVCKKEKE